MHKLLAVLVIAICTLIAGAENREDVEAFGNSRLEWFRTFLELPNGIPSHDPFRRVFTRLNSQQFQACFLGWMHTVSEVIGGQVIAMDDKVLRRSQDKGWARRMPRKSSLRLESWILNSHPLLSCL